MRFIPLFWGSLQQMGPCKSVKSFRAFVNARDFEQCEHIQIKDPKEARHYNQVTFTPIATYGHRRPGKSANASRRQSLLDFTK